MSSTRHPQLGWRAAKRLIALMLSETKWDRDTDPQTEWISTSRESLVHSTRFLSWIRSKDIPGSAELFLFHSHEAAFAETTWKHFIQEPFLLLKDSDIQMISKDLNFIFEYNKVGIARFGRRKPKISKNTAEQDAAANP